MDYLERVLDGVQGVFNVNPSTLSGAVDILVVRHADGSLRSTPFHARFGKLQLMRPHEKVVSISVNGTKAPFHMKLGGAGEAFFVHPVLDGEEVTSSELTSPFPSPPTSPKLRSASPAPSPATPPPTSPQQQQPSAPPQPMMPLGEAMKQLLQHSEAMGEKKLAWNWGELPAVVEAPDEHSIAPAAPEIPQLSLDETVAPEEVPAVPVTPAPAPKEEPTKKAEPKQAVVQPAAGTTKTTAPDDQKNVSGRGWRSVFRLFKGTPRPASTALAAPPATVPAVPTPEVPVPATAAAAAATASAVTPVAEAAPAKMEAGLLKASTETEDDDGDDDDDVEGIYEDAADLEGILVDSSVESPVAGSPVRHSASLAIPSAPSPPLTMAASPPALPIGNTSPVTVHRKQEVPAAFPVTGEELLAMTVQLSLCAQQVAALGEPDEQKIVPLFDASLMTFEQVASNPAILFDQNMMARLNGRFYSGTAAIALISSMVIFRKKFEIPAVAPASGAMGSVPKMAEKQARGWGWRLWPFPARIPANPSLPVAASATASTPPTVPAPAPALAVIIPLPAPVPEPAKAPVGRVPLLRKNVRPTHEQLETLSLKPGMNSIVFSVQSGAAVREVMSSIYLVDEDARIVISDIDGTITKSDALGHIFTAIGRDWSQSGVAQLFTAIHENGYHVLYLTARCIGVARSTRKFISSVKQKDKAEQHTLPPGPVFMSPMRLLSALDKEIVRKTPQEFKIACLTDILGLFPPGARPFYAGFGNRRSDVDSYRFVGVNEDKIFTINRQGYIRTRNRTYRKTYTTLHELVDDMFPPLDSGTVVLDEQFNDAN